MSIPEHQLIKWATLGAQQASTYTYNSIKTALSQHSWPHEMNHEIYLQGSYPNHTNIRGDSDVDIVVETSNVFYHDVPSYLEARAGIGPRGAYTWKQFRAEVLYALVTYYGQDAISESSSGKCINVSGRGSHRLDADVVPCATFRRYVDESHVASGITFWTKFGVQIINFPKLHIINGSRKNNLCNDHYKPNIRVFKNARNVVRHDFPSYFLECLLYNIPTTCFTTKHSETFFMVLKSLCQANNDGSLANFVCQNEQQLMFGPGLHQIDIGLARSLIISLVDLWNNWT